MLPKTCRKHFIAIKKFAKEALEQELFTLWVNSAGSHSFFEAFHFSVKSAFFYVLPIMIFHSSTAGAAQQQHSDFHSSIQLC